MQTKHYKSLIAAILLCPIAVAAETTIVCDGIETGWNSIFGNDNERKKTSQTHLIKNDTLNGFHNCPIKNKNKIYCLWTIGSGQIPDVVSIEYSVELDRVSGLLKQEQKTVTTAVSEILRAPVLRDYIGNRQTVTRVTKFEGYCKKATNKF